MCPRCRGSSKTWSSSCFGGCWFAAGSDGSTDPTPSSRPAHFILYMCALEARLRSHRENIVQIITCFAGVVVNLWYIWRWGDCMVSCLGSWPRNDDKRNRRKWYAVLHFYCPASLYKWLFEDICHKRKTLTLVFSNSRGRDTPLCHSATSLLWLGLFEDDI